MVVYFIAEIQIKNKDLFNKYVEKVHPIIEKYNGHYLIRGGKTTPFFGCDWNPERILVIEFSSSDWVKRCFNSPEYLKISALRENSTITRAIMVEGLNHIE